MAAEATAAVEAGRDFIQVIGKEGAFAIGTLLGCMISGFMAWLASGERTKRLSTDLEREKILLDLLKTKDERIDALHQRLETKPVALLEETLKTNLKV